MAGIVISYRRSDSQAMTGRLFDRLTERFGHDAVFMDIDKIPVGVDFREYVRKEIAGCNLMLIVIGDRWLEKDQNGQSHLHDPTDPVRIEIEAAIEQKVAIVPVLVNGIDMPAVDDLPESIRDLAYRNAAMVDAGRDFHRHVDDLIDAIEGLTPAGALEGQSPQDRKKWDLLPLRSLLAFSTPLLIAVGVYLVFELSPLYASRNADAYGGWSSRVLVVLVSLAAYYAVVVPAYSMLRRKRLDRRALAVYWAGSLPLLAAVAAWGGDLLVGLTGTTQSGAPPLLTSSSVVVAAMAIAILIGLVFASLAGRTITAGEMVTYWAGITGAAMTIVYQVFVHLAYATPYALAATIAAALLSSVVMIIARRGSMEMVERGTYRTTAWLTAIGLLLGGLITVLPWWGWLLGWLIVSAIAYASEKAGKSTVVLQVVSKEEARALNQGRSQSQRDTSKGRRPARA